MLQMPTAKTQNYDRKTPRRKFLGIRDCLTCSFVIAKNLLVPTPYYKVAFESGMLTPPYY